MLELESLLMRDGNPKIEKGNVQRRMKFQVILLLALGLMPLVDHLEIFLIADAGMSSCQELLDYCLENDKQKVQRVSSAVGLRACFAMAGPDVGHAIAIPGHRSTVDQGRERGSR
eukprot:2963065-Rhodomonas_salina.2